jgi:hypothetical protein
MDDLFRDRVPEAAARQLAVVLAWATECQLATVERLEMLSRTPKADLKRHSDIADTMVLHCHELRVTPQGLRGQRCTRLAERLAALETDAELRQ